MNRKVPVRFGGGEKMAITSKSYLFLLASASRVLPRRRTIHLAQGAQMEIQVEGLRGIIMQNACSQFFADAKRRAL